MNYVSIPFILIVSQVESKKETLILSGLQKYLASKNKVLLPSVLLCVTMSTIVVAWIPLAWLEIFISILLYFVSIALTLPLCV